MTSEREFNSPLAERKTEGISMTVHTLVSICQQRTNDSRGCFLLRTEWSGARKTGEGKFLRNHPDRPRGPPILLYNGCLVSFSAVKRPGLDADNPPFSSAGAEYG